MHVFAKLRTIAAIIVGALITLAVAGFTYVFRYPGGPRLWSKLMRRLSHSLLAGIDYQIEGDEIHVRDDELVVIYANHQSTGGLSEFNYWASVVLGRTPVYLVKRDLIWFVRWPIVRIGAGIPIDRDDPEAAAQAIRDAIPNIIANKQTLLIFCDSSRRTQQKAEHARRNKKLADVPHLEEMTEHVLPPRPGGLFQVLDAIGGQPVRIIEVANGFNRRVEGNVGMLNLCGSVFCVRAKEIRRSEIPGGKGARVAWLNRRYLNIARWLAQKRNMPFTPQEAMCEETKQANVA